MTQLCTETCSQEGDWVQAMEYAGMCLDGLVLTVMRIEGTMSATAVIDIDKLLLIEPY